MTTRANYKGYTVFIYDESGKELSHAKIVDHDVNTSVIEISPMMPQSSVTRVNLLIVTAPAPSMYSGTVKYGGLSTTISLFHGKTKEDRQAIRHAINTEATISALDDQSNTALGLPCDVTLMNISQTGLRFFTTNNFLRIGDIYKLAMKTKALAHTLIIEIVNVRDSNMQKVEYGCRFTEIQR
jgi:hypothetical protein